MTKQTSNTQYREVSLPGGTFRRYDDRPDVWVQILQPGEKSYLEKMIEAFENGEIKKF